MRDKATVSNNLLVLSLQLIGTLTLVTFTGLKYTVNPNQFLQRTTRSYLFKFTVTSVFQLKTELRNFRIFFSPFILRLLIKSCGNNIVT